MKKSLLWIVILVLSMSMVLGFSLAGCKAATTAATTAAATTAAAKTYEIVIVTKLQGIPWFAATEKGVLSAAKDLGVNAYQVGPAEADPAQQVKVIEDMVSKGVDAVLTWPNDSKSVEPIFQKAIDKGILTMTMENPNQKNVKWNVEYVDNTAWMNRMVEELVKGMGTEGQYVMFTGGATVASHNAWADIVEKILAEKYPDIKLATERIPTEESQIVAHDKMLEVMKAYPDLKGAVALGSTNPPGVAQAIREKGMIGKITSVGTALPSDAKQYLLDGSLTMSLLFDPVETTYAWVKVAYLTLTGQPITDGMEIKGLGKVKVEGQNITGSDVLTISKDNVDTFGF